MYVLHGGSSCLEWTDFALATVATRPDEAGGPPLQVLRQVGQPRVRHATDQLYAPSHGQVRHDGLAQSNRYRDCADEGDQHDEDRELAQLIHARRFCITG
jgi:hypothetical protein